jgi:hypothetical protein
MAPRGPAGAVRAHDFPDKDAPKAVPSGIYGLAADAGWVAVGCDGDTAAFAVATLHRWWDGEGRHRSPGADRLLITADAGGANGYRVRAWKQELAGFAHAAGLEVTVCHFPPGTSKWNQIEHRLVSRIRTNWRGRPLTTHEVVVNTIGATTTRTGLTVHAELDPGTSPTGVTIPDEVLQALPLPPTTGTAPGTDPLRPEPPTPPPVPRYQDRTQPKDQAPDWLHHPTLTGMGHAAFTDLLAEVEQYLLDHPRSACTTNAPATASCAAAPVPVRPAAGHRPAPSLEDPAPSPHRLARLASRSHRRRPARVDPRPGSLGRRITPAPITAPTAKDLANLIGKTDLKNASN